jgi:hypothetical protein
METHMTGTRWGGRRALGRLTLAAALTVAAAGTGIAQDACPIAPQDFEPDPSATTLFLPKWCSWRTQGNNPFFKLEPGYRIVLEDDEEKVIITVLDRTKWVDGVRTRVVVEDEFEKDGDELIRTERSVNYYARCEQTNSIFYFGEDVEMFDEDGNLISREGEWLAGRNGAKPGIAMPGTPLVGAKYYEEIAPADSALDKGEITAVEPRCTVDGEHFGRPCVSTVGTNDCNDDADEKVYVAGIGIVYDNGLLITDYGFIDDDEEDDD